MKFAVLTCTTENRKWLYDITNPTKEKFCKDYGYDYIFSTEFYADKEYEPGWNKIQFILKYLPNYDYVMWIDDDAGFIKFDNLENNLKDFFESKKSVYICKDRHDINSGVMIFKNSEFSKFMLETIWNHRHLYKDGKRGIPNTMEQPAIIDLLNVFTDDVYFGDGHIYNAYDTSYCDATINARTKDTNILHIAMGSSWKEANKDLIRKLFEM